MLQSNLYHILINKLYVVIFLTDFHRMILNSSACCCTGFFILRILNFKTVRGYYPFRMSETSGITKYLFLRQKMKFTSFWFAQLTKHGPSHCQPTAFLVFGSALLFRGRGS